MAAATLAFFLGAKVQKVHGCRMGLWISRINVGEIFRVIGSGFGVTMWR